MRIERKSSNRAGQFWLIVFKDKDDKRNTLNELRLTGKHLSESGKQSLYTLIRKISKRCEHNEKYQKGEEIASCIFKSDIDDIAMFMFVFASIVKDIADDIDEYKLICDRWKGLYDKMFNHFDGQINFLNCMVDYYKDKYGEPDVNEFKDWLKHRS